MRACVRAYVRARALGGGECIKNKRFALEEVEMAKSYEGTYVNVVPCADPLAKFVSSDALTLAELGAFFLPLRLKATGPARGLLWCVPK